MGHAEIAEAPGKRRDDHQRRIAPGGSGEDVRRGGEREIAGDAARVVHHGTPAAGRLCSEEEHDDKRRRHDDGLDQAGDRGGHEAAERAVGHDDRGREQHRRFVIKAEEAVEQLAASREARGRVGHEKDDDHKRADRFDDARGVAEAPREELRHRDAARHRAVTAQTARHDQPVEIGAGGKTDCRPTGLRHAAEHGQSRHAHQQIRAHVRGLGAHRRDHRAEPAPAEVKVLGAAVFRIGDADEQHTDEIYRDRAEYKYHSAHVFSAPFALDSCIIAKWRRGASAFVR